jgi:hypothetical protein
MAGKEMSMSETGWTPELVAERLAEAADVLARLPDTKMRGYYGPWRILVGGGVAALDDRPAQDRDAVERRGRTEPSEHQTTEQVARFCARGSTACATSDG